MKNFELTSSEIGEFSILPDSKFLDLHLKENDFCLDDEIYLQIEHLLNKYKLESYRIFYAIGSLIAFELSKQFITANDFSEVSIKSKIHQASNFDKLILEGPVDKIVITDMQLINQVKELLKISIPEPDELDELITTAVNVAPKKIGAPKKRINRFRNNLALHLITFLRLKEPTIFPSERKRLKFITEFFEQTGLQPVSTSTEQSIDTLKKRLGK